MLRFWEAKFSQITPLKRRGGRRYYRPKDIDLLLKIRKLLYQDGYTIKGVQKLLEKRVKNSLNLERYFSFIFIISDIIADYFLTEEKQ